MWSGFMSSIKALLPHPALMILEDAKQTMAITDLHIGFEAKFAEQGVHLETSIQDMLREALTLLSENTPDHLIILGDLKYSIDSVSTYEWAQVPSFLERLASRVKLSVIPGNHDGTLLQLLPRTVELLDMNGVLVGDVGLLHGHTVPAKHLQKAKRIVMGHTHPVYSREGSPLTGRPVWLFLRTFKKFLFKDTGNEALEVVVLPSFNRELALAGFTSFRERLISPILRRIRGQVEDAVIMTLDGDIIGGVEDLDYVL